VGWGTSVVICEGSVREWELYWVIRGEKKEAWGLRWRLRLRSVHSIEKLMMANPQKFMSVAGEKKGILMEKKGRV